MSEPFGLTIFCDDIRAEIGGKHTYVGVYGADLQVVGDTPVTLPLLSCVVNIVIPYGFSYKNFRLVIKLKSDSSEIVITDITGSPIPPVSSKEKVARQVFNISITSFVIEQNGVLMVRAYFDDLEVRLGALDIRVVPSPQPTQTT